MTEEKKTRKVFIDDFWGWCTIVSETPKWLLVRPDTEPHMICFIKKGEQK